MGINANIYYKKVDQTMPTRSRHVSQSGGTVFIDFKRNKRATWHSLIHAKRESTTKLIVADQFCFLCFAFVIFRFVVLFLLSVAFVVLYLKENKRVMWRSLIRAKGRNLWQN